MPKIGITFVYKEGEADDHLALKVSLPESWAESPCARARALFVQSYRAKKPEAYVEKTLRSGYYYCTTTCDS